MNGRASHPLDPTPGLTNRAERNHETGKLKMAKPKVRKGTMDDPQIEYWEQLYRELKERIPVPAGIYIPSPILSLATLVREEIERRKAALADAKARQ